MLQPEGDVIRGDIGDVAGGSSLGRRDVTRTCYRDVIRGRATGTCFGDVLLRANACESAKSDPASAVLSTTHRAAGT